MNLRQVAGIGERTARETLFPRIPINFDELYERRIPDNVEVRPGLVADNTAVLRSCLADVTRDRYRDRAQEAADGTPTFLNQTINIAAGTDVEWYDDRLNDLPLLWSLKLYAFQPLSWLCCGVTPGSNLASTLQATFDGWIMDWTESVAIGRPGYLRRAWTPWAVSLRVLHWSRYLAWRSPERGQSRNDFERTLTRELYKNALFLRNHIERDVGGNHLIENGAALLTAGLLFGNRSWINQGQSILTEAAANQFLDDSCHFERSPMYHVLTLTRYLTVCDLLERSQRAVPRRLQRTAAEGTAFLRYLRPPNGRLPLLNDAVYGQGLPLTDCLQYADSIGFGSSETDRRIESLVCSSGRKASNYRWLRTNDGSMLVDGGHVGPPHLPGHSHSDTFSFLLWLDKQPVVTDTGTFGYTSDTRRTYARGVRGHNTVQVNDTEPVALAGKYLMGPRPDTTTRFEEGTVSLFEGRYEATPLVDHKYVHHRSIYTSDRWWLVSDTISKYAGTPSIRSRLHLHPDVDTSVESTDRVRISVESDEAFIYPLESSGISVATGEYFPRFGVTKNRPVLEVHHKDTGSIPATISFLITRQECSGPTVRSKLDGSQLRDLSMNNTKYSLPRSRLTKEQSRPDQG